MAHVELGSLLSGLGAPPPLLSIDGEEEKTEHREKEKEPEKNEKKDDVREGAETPPAMPSTASAASSPAAAGAAVMGAGAVSQPPELLPPGEDSSRPPQLLTADAGMAQQRSQLQQQQQQMQQQQHQLQQQLALERLKLIRTQKEAVQKELERLQTEEEELQQQVGQLEGGRPGTPTVQSRVVGDGTAPPPLVTPPTQGINLPPSSVQPGQVLTLDQALRMASAGWSFSSGPPPHPPQTQTQPSALQRGVSSETILKVLQHSRLTEFVRDQGGLAWLQRSCEEGKPNEVTAIFDVLVAEPPDVFADPVTSPLIPVLFVRLTDQQKDTLVKKIATNMSQIAFNMHGTRVVQKVIDLISSKQQVEFIVSALTKQVPQLVKDLNGNHVIQQVLQSFPSDVNQFIHDILLTRVVEFGTHRHGCCVLQRCIEFGSDSQKMQLVYEVINNGLCLVQDPFGNYLLQYILEMDLEYINVKVIRQFLGNIPALSMNKFASNVIEKCLKIAPDDVRQLIVDELADRSKLPLLLQDQYANYVIQTALHTCSQTQFYNLQLAIRPLIHLIKSTPHGKRIETKLRTRTFDNSPTSTPQRQRHYQTRASDALGVTPDGQWLRGAQTSTPSSHVDPSTTPPLSLTPPSAFLPAQAVTPGSAGGFRLNANARPFVSPPSGSPTPPGAATPERAPHTSGNVGNTVAAAAAAAAAATSPAPQKNMHPALVFGSLDD